MSEFNSKTNQEKVTIPVIISLEVERALSKEAKSEERTRNGQAAYILREWYQKLADKQPEKS